MTNIAKHNTWKSSLQAQDGAASDATVTALGRLLIVNDATTQAELIQLLRAEGDLVFLARHPEGHLVWVHHLTVHGGGRIHPDIYFTALVGIGPRAFPIKFNSGQLFRSLSVMCPTWTNLKDLTSRQALVDAPLGQTEEVFPTLLALPPSISSALMDEPDRDPHSFLAPLKAAITAFDNGQEDGPVFGPNAHVRHIPKWLWAAATDHLPVFSLVFSENPIVVGWSDRLHDSYITGGGHPTGQAPAAAAGAAAGGQAGAGPVEASLAAALLQQAAATREFAEETKNSRVSREEASAKKNPGWGRLPEATQKMMTHASQTVSRVGQIQGEVPQSAKDFLSNATSANADVFLQQYLVREFGLTGKGMTGMASRLYTGVYLWSAVTTPSNLTIFDCAPPDVLAGSNAGRSASLALTAREGKGLTEDQVKLLTKQKLSWPQDTETAAEQLATFAGVLKMLFAESELYHFVNEWSKHMKAHPMEYRTCQTLDYNFFLGMFYFIDKTVQAFLSNCIAAPSRVEVSDSIFSCEQKKTDIILHQNPFTVPAAFSPDLDGLEGEVDLDTEEQQASPKREREKRRKTLNRKPLANLNVQRQGFGKKYGSGCAAYATRPKVRGCSFCVTWHLLNYCHEGCPCAASHVEPSESEEKAIRKYCNDRSSK